MPTSEQALKYLQTVAKRPDQIAIGTEQSSGIYSITQHSYPSDITQRPDLQHYVGFYINVRSKTNLKNITKYNLDVSAKNNTERLKDTAITAGAATGAAAGMGITYGVDKLLGGALGKRAEAIYKQSGGVSNKASKIGMIFATNFGKGAAAAGGAIGGGLLTNKALDTIGIDIPQRITDAIILPIEQPPSTSYGIKYTQEDLGLAGAIGSFMAGGASAEDTTKALLEGSGELGMRGLAALGNIPKAFGMGSLKTSLQVATKMAVNPFRETLFEAINFRTFRFKYTFLPKSQQEVLNVQRIIALFKLHMHPELSEKKLFYIYPSEFEIVYYFKGKENNFMNKIATCVLTDMTVNYGGEYFTSFADGAPAEISLSLSFQELELLTKERIQEGY